MEPIFDGPMFLVQVEEAGGISLGGWQARNAIDDLLSAFEGMFHTTS